MPPRTDYLLLNASTSANDVDALIAKVLADSSDPHGIVVPPVFARRAVDALRGSGVRVASVVAYPLGLAKPTIKAIEATSLAKDGVDAVELTPLSANLIIGDWDALRDELLEIVRGVRAARQTTSVHVRLDLDQLACIDFQAAADAITRGACDGVVLEAESADVLRRVSAAFAASSLAVKLVTDADRSPLPAGVGRRAFERL